MSNDVEKSFSGFVKVVIGVTGLFVMGAVIAGGALIKGFKEGAKSVKDALNDQDYTKKRNFQIPRMHLKEQQPMVLPKKKADSKVAN